VEHGRYSYKSLRIFFLIFLLFPIARAASLQHFGKSETYFVILLERLEVQAPNVYIGQEFWVRAIFVAGYMPYDANNFTATIELPEGFKLKEGQTYSHKNPAIPAYGFWATEWVVVAPNKTGTYIINVSVDSSFPQKKSVTIVVTHKPVNPVIEIRGTEYQSGEVGTIYAQIRDADGTPINLANCTIRIYYPDRTLWVEDKLNYLYGSLGLYYYTFIVPSIEGVYSISVNCSNPEVYGFSTFHVARWANQIYENLKYWEKWNLTFYLWNDTYFANWNGTIINLNENWKILWDLWDCEHSEGYPKNEVCDYLSKIRASVEETKTNVSAIKVWIKFILSNITWIIILIVVFVIAVLVIKAVWKIPKI